MPWNCTIEHLISNIVQDWMNNLIGHCNAFDIYISWLVLLCCVTHLFGIDFCMIASHFPDRCMKLYLIGYASSWQMNIDFQFAFANASTLNDGSFVEMCNSFMLFALGVFNESTDWLSLRNRFFGLKSIDASMMFTCMSTFHKRIFNGSTFSNRELNFPLSNIFNWFREKSYFRWKLFMLSPISMPLARFNNGDFSIPFRPDAKIVIPRISLIGNIFRANLIIYLMFIIELIII